MDTKSVGVSDEFAAREARKRGDVDFLLRILVNGDRIGRLAAAQDLGSLRSTRAVEPLLRCIRASDELLQVSALKALGKIRDRSVAAEVFEVAASDESLGVRATAAETLARLGDQRAADLLAAILMGGAGKRHARSYRRWAAKLLAELYGAGAIQHLEVAKEQAGPLERWQLGLTVRRLRSSHAWARWRLGQ